MTACVANDSLGDVLTALHVVMLTVRRCHNRIQRLDEPDIHGTCQRAATWRRTVSPTASAFSCDLCHRLYGAGDGWVEAPHAAAVRQFDMVVCNHEWLWAPDDAVASVEPVASGVLEALPPCTRPLSCAVACARCVWADGLEPEQRYRARRALDELRKTIDAYRMKD